MMIYMPYIKQKNGVIWQVRQVWRCMSSAYGVFAAHLTPTPHPSPFLSAGAHECPATLTSSMYKGSAIGPYWPPGCPRLNPSNLWGPYQRSIGFYRNPRFDLFSSTMSGEAPRLAKIL